MTHHKIILTPYQHRIYIHIDTYFDNVLKYSTIRSSIENIHKVIEFYNNPKDKTIIHIFLKNGMYTVAETTLPEVLTKEYLYSNFPEIFI